MHRYISVLLLIVLLSACIKENPSKQAASLTLVNAVTGSKPLSVTFNATGRAYFKDTWRMNYGEFNLSSNRYSRAAGTNLVQLYQYPDTLQQDKPLYNLQLDLPAASITSLFLTGSANDPDSLLIRETIPAFASTDTSMNIRFINLSKGSDPVTVNLQGKSAGSEAAVLAYKGFTGFQKYRLKTGAGKYVFEFRDVATNNILATHTVDFIDNADNRWVYRTYTLAFIGKPGGIGTEAFRTLLIQHGNL